MKVADATRGGSGLRGGIDLGGTKIQAVVVSSSHRVLGEARRPTPTEGGPEAVVDALASAMAEAAASAGTSTRRLAGAGVGSPGSVDAMEGTVTRARNLPDWEGTFPLAARLGRRLGCPVHLGNDVQVTNLAELRLGAGRDRSSFLGVSWGTGVGGNIVLEGRQWRGRGAAGEIGHTVVVREGAQCTCGRRGCVEAYAGRAAMEIAARRRADRGEKTVLFRIMRQQGRPRLTSGVWARALEDGDAVARDLMDGAVQALGTGIASAINLLDIGAVILEGGLGVRLGQPYAERIAAAMRPRLFLPERAPEVMVASLGDLGGAIGAALLVERPAARRSPAPGARAAAG
jgi:glucokinase